MLTIEDILMKDSSVIVIESKDMEAAAKVLADAGIEYNDELHPFDAALATEIQWNSENVSGEIQERDINLEERSEAYDQLNIQNKYCMLDSLAETITETLENIIEEEK